MLVLSRKAGEEIVLPTRNVHIVVLGVRGNRVRLGIEAPLTEPVYREEVLRGNQDAELPAPPCHQTLLEVS